MQGQHLVVPNRQGVAPRLEKPCPVGRPAPSITFWHPPVTLADLELTRTRDDRRLYALEGVGTLRLKGVASRAAVADADAGSWQIRRRGFLGRKLEATARTGAVVGEFEPRATRGGTLDWDGRKLTLRPASHWRERYALADG